MDPKQYLTEWLERYLRNKDLFFRRILSMETKIGRISVKYKDKEQEYFIEPIIKKIEAVKEKAFTLVVLNSKENLNFLIKNWDAFVRLGKNFSIFFVNPFSKTEKFWTICPSVHNFITERPVLSTGLKTMFEQVDAITEAEFEKVIK